MKRLIDIVVAAAGIIVLSPLLAVVALAVLVMDGAPVLYQQERIGLGFRPFRLHKFRTMKVGADTMGPRVTSQNDPRVTRLGRFLRHTKLDELPQLYNVLRGDMSLVGPRPERPVFIEEFKRQIPKYHLRHKVKSGITGWAQINGLRGQTSIQKRIEYDLYYIENWSLLLDLKILIRTALGGFLSRNAY
jgi:exopolysaccharide biosynthesis polyprenyl glycosylphosphotransferase